MKAGNNDHLYEGRTCACQPPLSAGGRRADSVEPAKGDKPHLTFLRRAKPTKRVDEWREEGV